ncbi:MAG: ABC transporter ATP-binding protein [Liquorilactobacillus ghanensis]|jgi:ABC-2 type transport system ATP-binding protein|uniref:ABC transporter, ATP-binding protein n=1 Tax=Liquorilactobacillus ghanensis DSM 18630 TaxID=1423750 RepID=A0A0R1VQ67_9LACO|nr:ABC transporter ATP-binding protein [Liquorilactobacillus ghanensis]KRM07573.1 ABC transporter, ATP-binding protein [Liquorilactobacillus ghanensis DSM 18630]
MSLEVKNLVGGYSQIPVLKNISFQVEPGQIVGLIGLNGAGKSTTINHIIGLLRPQQGTIMIDQVSLQQNPQAYKQSLAYIPEMPVLYTELTLREHLDLTIMAYKLNRQQAWKKAERLLKIFRLDNKLDWFPAKFSKGMRQKVMIVCAFLNDSNYYVIDEPFLGLDPLATRDLLHLIAAEKKRGAGILMSTHVLSTAQTECDYFILLHAGKIKAQGNLAKLRQQAGITSNQLDDIYFALTEEDRYDE